MLILSITDIILGRNLIHLLIIFYGVLLAISLLLMYYPSPQKTYQRDPVKTFEKSLQGGLYHFKCKTCNGIFAIKESMYSGKKSVIMTCPDCGAIGRIPAIPPIIMEEIPEEKSENIHFKCAHCGEGLTIWAEGTDLYKEIQVFSCPFCGVKQPMKRV